MTFHDPARIALLEAVAKYAAEIIARIRSAGA